MKSGSRDFIRILHNRIAELAVGPSALRNQGATGVINAAREYFKKADALFFVAANKREFGHRLDRATEELRRRFPRNARHWGTARKAINLFLRDVSYSSVLSRHYHMERVEQWLEVPLDRDVSRGIQSDFREGVLPQWKGVKHLTPKDSATYQKAAQTIANEKQLARVHLDLFYWRRGIDK